MRTFNLQVPETLITQVADAIADLDVPCPRHGHECHKTLVALDDCQIELLRLIELTGHGYIEIKVAEGRPTDVHYRLSINGMQIRQDVRLGKDPQSKVIQLLHLIYQTGEDAA